MGSEMCIRDGIEQAERGSRLAGGGHALEGEGPSPDGAFFDPHGTVLHVHPPWKGGTGVTYARFDVALPDSGELHFESSAAMDKGAVGRTDGATFSVRVESSGETLEEAVHTAGDTPVPVQLDLTRFAGRTVTFELAVDPGPANNPTCCLLYTSDAADELPRVDLGGRPILKKNIRLH